MTGLSRPQAVFFDWDGTLVDSFALILAAHNHARAELGMEPFTAEDFQPYFGKPREVLYPGIYGENGEAAREYFEGFVTENHSKYIKAMVGAESLLKTTRDMGITMGLVSNKRRDFIELELNHLKWNDFFISVVGAAEAEEDKPSSTPLYLGIERSGQSFNMEDIWYVGDTEIDMLCARNAGCCSVFVNEDDAALGCTEGYQPSVVVKNCTALEQFLLQCPQK